MEHSNLLSKEQLPVDYSIGKFLLVYASVWSKLLQNISCIECGEQEISVEFSDAIGHSSKIILSVCLAVMWLERVIQTLIQQQSPLFIFSEMNCE